MGIYRITLPNGDMQEIWVLLYKEVEEHIEWLGFKVSECKIEKISK